MGESTVSLVRPSASKALLALKCSIEVKLTQIQWQSVRRAEGNGFLVSEPPPLLAASPEDASARLRLLLRAQRALGASDEEAIGLANDTPTEVSRSFATPRELSAATTAAARRCDRSMLKGKLPTLSVWPTTCTVSAGAAASIFAISVSAAADSGLAG